MKWFCRFCPSGPFLPAGRPQAVTSNVHRLAFCPNNIAGTWNLLFDLTIRWISLFCKFIKFLSHCFSCKIGLTAFYARIFHENDVKIIQLRELKTVYFLQWYKNLYPSGQKNWTGKTLGRETGYDTISEKDKMKTGHSGAEKTPPV